MRGDILVIDLTTPYVPVIEAGKHLHFCPVCYQYVGCAYACSCPGDLTLDDGTPCGSTAPCAFCEAEEKS